MKKYFIFGIGRTGSTLYSNLLDIYYKSILPQENNICYSADKLKIDWSFPIQHTHQFNAIKDIPEDFVFLLTTRCILDSLLSVIVAETTNFWTVTSDKDKINYINQFSNKKIKINIPQFIHRAESADYSYYKILKEFEKSSNEKFILKYNECTTNFNVFYQKIGINFAIDTQQNVFQKIPIDKFSMIENLEEIYIVYKNLNLRNNFEDDSTLDFIKKNYIDNTSLIV
jgi:hypothetical protein